jgi:hypothetical protein
MRDAIMVGSWPKQNGDHDHEAKPAFQRNARAFVVRSRASLRRAVPNLATLPPAMISPAKSAP